MSEELFSHIVLVGKSLFGLSLHENIKHNFPKAILSALWTGKKKYAGMSTKLLDNKAPVKASFLSEADLFIVYLPFDKAVRWLKQAEEYTVGKNVLVVGAPFISQVLKREGIGKRANIIEADIALAGYTPEHKLELPERIILTCLADLGVGEKNDIESFLHKLGTACLWQDYSVYEKDILSKSIVPRLVKAEMIMQQRRIKKHKRQAINLPEVLFVDNISKDVLFMKKEKIIPLLKEQENVPVKVIRALRFGRVALLGAIYKNRNLKI